MAGGVRQSCCTTNLLCNGCGVPKARSHRNFALTGGPSANRAAIGARVAVKAGDITQTREVGGGHGHYGAQDDLTVHVGLGPACEALVTVRWPDAELSTQTFTLPAGYRFTLTQGEAPKAVPKQGGN